MIARGLPAMAMPVAPDPLEAASSPWHSDDFEARAFAFGPSETRRFTAIEESILRGDGGITRAGISMTPSLALRVGTVFACKRVIAEDIGKLPVKLRRRSYAGGRIKTAEASDDPLFRLLCLAPNDWMTAQELYEYMVGQAVVHRAGYARLVRDQRGRVTEILPLLPGSCRREQLDDWSVQYRITGYALGQEIVAPESVWCLNGFMETPLDGYATADMAREAVALASALETSQARFHARDRRPSGVLTTKNAIKPEQREAIRAAWNRAYGPEGEGTVAVLDTDFDFRTVSVTAADSQTIESREFQIEDICRFFRVFPWAVMRQASTQSYGSLEQTQLAHGTHTLLPWVRRVELSVQRDILGVDSDIYLKLNMDAIARAALGDRVGAYDKAVRIFLTPNEIRELEDRDPLDDVAADKVQFQANNTGMKPAASTTPAAKPAHATPSASQLDQPQTET